MTRRITTAPVLPDATPTTRGQIGLRSSDGALTWHDGTMVRDVGWNFIASTSITVAAATIGPITLPEVYDELLVVFRVPSLSASDTVNLRFNGDTAANYWWRGITSVKTTTTGSAPTLVDTFLASATRLALFPIAGTTQVAGQALISNRAASTKLVTIDAKTASAAAATVPTTLLAGSGEWVNTAAQINSVTMLTAGGTSTMAVGSGFAVFGRNC